MDYSNIKKVINLTPHEVRVYVGSTVHKLSPSGRVARLRTTSKPHGTVHEMPVVLSGEDGVVNVPEPTEGIIYIASSVVAKSLKREDVLSPDTTDEGVLRDGVGKVFAVKRLQCFSETGE